MLIALNSPAPQMGKSTVANRLIAKHDFHLVKFAAPLKDMVRLLLVKHCGIDPLLVERYVDGDLKEAVIPELEVTSRHLQQTLGTEWGRDQVRPDLWVHVTGLKVRALLDQGKRVVIDDMRFINEHDMVLCLGGRALRVFRQPDAMPAATGHRSEGELDRLNMDNMPNFGTVDQLHIDVDSFVRHLSTL